MRCHTGYAYAFDADPIAFLADGKAVESGTHEALMRQRGRYHAFAAAKEAGGG